MSIPGSRPWRQYKRSPHATSRSWRAVAAMLATACALTSCGGSGRPVADARALSEAEYLAVVRRDCLIAQRAAEQAGRTTAVPVVYLQRAAEAAESIQRDFAKLRPPIRFLAAHRTSVRLGEEQLALIRTAIVRLQRGESSRTVAALQARNRRLQRRANKVADQLGVPECIDDVSGQ